MRGGWEEPYAYTLITFPTTVIFHLRLSVCLSAFTRTLTITTTPYLHHYPPFLPLSPRTTTTSIFTTAPFSNTTYTHYHFPSSTRATAITIITTITFTITTIVPVPSLPFPSLPLHYLHYHSFHHCHHHHLSHHSLFAQFYPAFLFLIIILFPPLHSLNHLFFYQTILYPPSLPLHLIVFPSSAFPIPFPYSLHSYFPFHFFPTSSPGIFFTSNTPVHPLHPPFPLSHTAAIPLVCFPSSLFPHSLQALLLSFSPSTPSIPLSIQSPNLFTTPSFITPIPPCNTLWIPGAFHHRGPGGRGKRVGVGGDYNRGV